MSLPAVTFRSELSPVVRKELDQQNVELGAYVLVEHDEDGRHTDITASSLTLETNPAIGASGDLVVDGAGTFGGPITTTPYVDIAPVIPGDPAPRALETAPTFATNDGRILLGLTGSSAGNGHFGPGLRIHGVPGGTLDNDWALVASQDGIGSVLALVHCGDATAPVETPLKIRPRGVLGAHFEILPHAVTNGTIGVTLGSHQGGFFAGYEPFKEINVIDSYATGGYFEQGRAAALGDWTDVPFSAAAFGPAGWTVTGFVSYAYMRLGHTMWITLSIDPFQSTLDAVSNGVTVAIPAGAVCNRRTVSYAWANQSSGAYVPATVFGLTGATVLNIHPAAYPAPFPAGAFGLHVTAVIDIS